MLCWKPEVQSLEFESNLSNASLQDDYFEPCELHGKPIAFICRNETCRDKNDSMACNQCLISHKTHKWITIEDFLTPNIKNILTFRSAQTDYMLMHSKDNLLAHLSKIQEEINIQFELIKDTLEKSMERVKEKYRFNVEKTIGSSKVILDTMKLEKLMHIYDIEESQFGWIRAMEKELVQISDKVYESFTNLLHDLYNLANAEKWEYKEQDKDEFKEFEKHLHQHVHNDYRYYLFSNTEKHMNIQLNKELDQAIYIRSVPSKPVAIASDYITQIHSQFGFEIMKMESKAIFFNSTVVYLGICNVNSVKSFGYRKVSEFGKGSYLISSEGYAYHSTDQNFNNKEIVGWGFGQGDIILVEIIFDTECTIRFRKKSRFFENTFEMPLKMNEFKMSGMRPCVSFDSQEGAIVRIFDVEQRGGAGEE